MSSDQVVHNFSLFSPADYLKEYYSEIGTENAFLLDFLHAVHSVREPAARMLEIGGGPTVYQLISACRRTEEIVFSEYLPQNREQVELFRAADPRAFDWSAYFEYVLRLEGADHPTADRVAERKDELRHKIRAVVPYDARSETPLGPFADRFELVAVNFCLESITADEREYRRSLETMTEYLATGGLLVMTALKQADYYHVGKLKFPAFPVDEKSLDRYLNELSYGSIEIRSLPAEHSQGYEGLIALSARKES